MYQRSIGPQFQFGSPMAHVSPSQGAGGAIPNASPMPMQDNGAMDPTQIGGLLGMLKNMQGDPAGQSDFSFDANKTISALPNLENGVQFGGIPAGQSPNNLGGMSFMNGPQGSGMADYFKNLLGGA